MNESKAGDTVGGTGGKSKSLKENKTRVMALESVDL